MPSLYVVGRWLLVLAMLAAVAVMTQQSNAPFVYGGF